MGEKGASDGLEADDKGRIYAGDYERNSVRQRQTDGEWKTIAHDPRILWPDTLSVASDGYLCSRSCAASLPSSAFFLR